MRFLTNDVAEARNYIFNHLGSVETVSITSKSRETRNGKLKQLFTIKISGKDFKHTATAPALDECVNRLFLTLFENKEEILYLIP